MFVEESTQEFGVLLVVSTADLADAVERAECTGVSLSSKHHHLVRVDVHSYILEHKRQKHKCDVRIVAVSEVECNISFSIIKAGIRIPPSSEVLNPQFPHYTTP